MRTMGRLEQQTIDRLAEEELGLVPALLMEHAAMAIVRELRAMKATSVSFFCGRGNNGGDAYAAARLLLDFVEEIRVFEDEQTSAALSIDAARNRSILRRIGLQAKSFESYEAVDGEVVVDALFGTAFRIDRGMPDEYINILHKAAAARSAGRIRILAVDLPSGVEADSGLVHPDTAAADRTLSFIYPKTGIVAYPGRKFAGEISLDPIGLAARWLDKVWLDQGFTAPLALDKSEFQDVIHRQPDSHKGSNGRVCIMAGSPGMGGAAILACRAAISGGSGLVRLVIPESLYTPALNAVPSALLEVIPTDLDKQLEWWQSKIKGQDAVAIGPGIGQPDPTRPRLRDMILEAIMNAPRLLIDADALNLLALPDLIDWARAALMMRTQMGLEPAILTPHPGEAKRLLPEEAILVMDDRIAAAKRLAALWSSVVVLKGAGTVIAFPSDEVCMINTSGNPGLGKGGSGDLLTGLMTSFLGQSMPLKTAVSAAVYLHGLAADLASKERGERALCPEELLDYMPQAYETIGWG